MDHILRHALSHCVFIGPFALFIIALLLMFMQLHVLLALSDI